MTSLALVPTTDAVAWSPRPSTATEAEAVVEITIVELVQMEERLAHQAHLGDLHPAHARRLAAITAELDRRWADFA